MDMKNPIRIAMLGRFSLSDGENKIDDEDNRSRKVWLLLSYIIYFRRRSIPQEELINLLWGEDGRSECPVNALKTMFHRVRIMLDGLGEDAGRELIVRRNGTYAWNNSVGVVFDLDDFEALCREGAAEKEPEIRLKKYRSAIELYAGDFLSKFSAEPWVVPVNAYFHNLYVQTVRETISLLEAAGSTDEVVALCRRAVEIEPYEEDIYRHLMENLLKNGGGRDAVAVYKSVRDILFNNFGVSPSEETVAVYRKAINSINDREVSIDTVCAQLREKSESDGALLCDYDMFKTIYHIIARSIVRSGEAVHVGLVTVSGAKGALPKRSRDVSMENLLEQVRMNLRRGDVVSRCSISQYVVMLQQSDYENSCMVMERICRSFGRRYPHSPALLRYSVQPVEPSV